MLIIINKKTNPKGCIHMEKLILAGEKEKKKKTKKMEQIDGRSITLLDNFSKNTII